MTKYKKVLDPKIFNLGIAVIVYLTILISIFDFNPDLNEWLLEIGRNFILISSITMTYVFIYSIFSGSLRNKIPLPVFYILLSLFVSIAGGTIGWQLNVLLFGFRITHLYIFFIIIFLVTLFTSFSIYSYISFRDASVKLLRQESEKQRLLKLKLDVELQLIRAKINPHFLFNTLNSVVSLIPTNPVLAEEMIIKLSNFLRYILDKNDYEFTTLENEINLIDEYLSIEKLRFGKRLEYRIDVDNILKSKTIPAMLLQPLVENCIKHGLSETTENGLIIVTAEKSDKGDMIIKISDNGRGFDPDEEITGFGLSSVRERLELTYGNKHSFRIDNKEGSKISITLMNQA